MILDTDFAPDDITSIVMLSKLPEFKYISLVDGFFEITDEIVSLVKRLLILLNRSDIKVILNSKSENYSPYPVESEIEAALNAVRESIAWLEGNSEIVENEIVVLHDLENHIGYGDEIIAIGALTNIARIADRKVKVLIGGTNLFVPNIVDGTNVEFNIYFDVEAAIEVFNSTTLIRTVVPVDTTMTIKTGELINKLEDKTDRISTFVRMLNRLNDPGNDLFLFDETTVAYYLDSTIFLNLKLNIEIDIDGESIPWNGNENIVVVKPDNKPLLDRIFGEIVN